MPKKLFIAVIILFYSFVHYQYVKAQTYMGISANIGNKLSYSPPSKGLERPVAISGSLLFTFQKELQNNWIIQYGIDLGVLGYNLKIKGIDSLLTGDNFVFLEYGTFCGRGNILGGKEFIVKNKKLMIGLGGGATFYYTPYSVTAYGISIGYPDYTTKRTFRAVFDGPETKTLPFAKIVVQLKMNSRYALGIGYLHHFKPVLEGTYEFYHTESTSAGKLSLYHQEINLMFFLNISKSKE